MDVNSVNEQDGWNCLHYLSVGQHGDHFKKLVDQGADFTKANIAGDTPWLSACAKGDMEIMNYLLDEKEVDVNSVNEQDGWTCLHYLSARQHEDHFKTTCRSRSRFNNDQ